MPQELIKPKRANLPSTQLESLIKRAHAGDETAAPEIRRLLTTAPALVQPLGGNLAHEAERLLVNLIAKTNVGQREAIYRKMAQLRSELAGRNPQPLERLLIERVVLCWLHAHFADCQFAQAGAVTLQHGDFLQRQQDRAHRRYLAAIKSLATIRRLALPIKVDVTVGELTIGRD